MKTVREQEIARYREAVRRLFLETLKEVPEGTLQERRIYFFYLFQVAHIHLIRNFTKGVYQDCLTWKDFNGTAILTYEPYYTMKKTEFKFTYPKGVIN